MSRSENGRGKAKVMGISRQPSTVQIMIDGNNWRIWNIANIWAAL
jgi:hypothetical protein